MNSANPLSNLPTVTKNLLIINLVCFVGSMIFENSTRLFGVYYPDSPFFKVWQIITYMFMHGGFTHIFFNMFSLVMFGPIVEQVMGAKRFLNFYLLTGIGALILQFGVQAFEVYQIAGTVNPSSSLKFDMISGMVYTDNPLVSQSGLGTLVSIYNTPLVGASGAIFGLLLAFAYLFPNLKLALIFLPVPIKAKFFIPILIFIEIYLGFSNSGGSIAHLAHVGGALFGYLLLKGWGIKKGIY